MNRFFLIGMMGSGKTSYSKKWAKKFNLTAYDLDNMVEACEQMTINEIFTKKGEAYFRKLETDILKTFAEKDKFILATGGGVPCFHNNMQWMNENGTTIWLHENLEILYGRLKKAKMHRPLLKDFNDAELKSYIYNMLKEREYFYSMAKHTFKDKDISHHTFKKLIEEDDK